MEEVLSLHTALLLINVMMHSYNRILILEPCNGSLFNGSHDHNGFEFKIFEAIKHRFAAPALSLLLSKLLDRFKSPSTASAWLFDKLKTPWTDNDFSRLFAESVDWRRDGEMDGRYKVHYLPHFAVDKHSLHFTQGMYVFTSQFSRVKRRTVNHTKPHKMRSL